MQLISVRNVSTRELKIGNAQAIVIGADAYEGEHTITPSNMAQVLPVKGYSMRENIIVEPIPQNYGLITYNGFELTVS